MMRHLFKMLIATVLFMSPSATAALAQSESKTAFMKEAIAEIARSRGGGDAFALMPRIIPFGDWDYFYIDGPLGWVPDFGEKFDPVVVPKGFVTDLASIPQPFWRWLPRTGRYAYAAIVHDYLYWIQTVPRSEADRIFRLAMLNSLVDAATITVIYESVKSGGQSAWDANAKLKAAGEKRILRRFPQDPLISWNSWRQRQDVLE